MNPRCKSMDGGGEAGISEGTHTDTGRTPHRRAPAWSQTQDYWATRQFHTQRSAVSCHSSTAECTFSHIEKEKRYEMSWYIQTRGAWASEYPSFIFRSAATLWVYPLRCWSDTSSSHHSRKREMKRFVLRCCLPINIPVSLKCAFLRQ